jgi:hypothetical protein
MAVTAGRQATEAFSTPLDEVDAEVALATRGR